MRAVIQSTIASMRDEPLAMSSLSDEVLYGMEVEILKETRNGWCKVRTDYRYEGYLPSGDLLFDNQMPKMPEGLKQRRIVQAYADVLSEPRVQGILLQGLTRGAVVYEEPSDDLPEGWTKIRLYSGEIGFIKQRFLGTCYKEQSGATEEETRKNIIDTATTYLGTQYRWGGKTPLGIDCSGLASMAYLINGITIFRDAHIKEGFPIHEIQFEKKKPADLLFFEGHVAIYLGGNRYVHATAKPGSDGVVINSLHPDDEDYREDLAHGVYATGSIF